MNSMKWFTAMLIVVSVNADCTSDSQKCVDTFVEALNSSEANSPNFCNTFEEFIKCGFSHGCHLNSIQKQLLIDRSEKDLEEFHCPFTLAELLNRYDSETDDHASSAKQLLSSITTSVIVFLSFMLYILN